MKNKLYFLEHSGELAQIIREKDWSGHMLGKPQMWPQTLKICLSLMLNSRFPMFLFWGKELICFYNDAYRPSLGENGKHPQLVGMTGIEGWPDIWDFVKGHTDHIFNGGDAIWYENQLVPIFRNGKMEDVFWTYSYSAVKNEDGEIAGVLVTAQETTEAVNSVKALEESNNRFHSLILQAPTAICILRIPDLIFEIANDAYLSILSKSRDEVIGKKLYNVLPEVETQIKPVIEEVIKSGKPFYGNEYLIQLFRNGKTEDGYFNFIYQPVKDEEGKVTALMVVATEVSGLVQSKISYREEKERLRLSTESTKTSTWELNVITNELIHSQSLAEIFGYSPKTVLDYATVKSHVNPEDKVNIVDKALKRAFKTGKYFYEARITDAKGKEKWISTSGTVFYDDKNVPGRMLGILTDITEKVHQRQIIEETINKLNIALQASSLGIFELHVPTRNVEHSDRIPEMFGYPYGKKIDLDIANRHLFAEFIQTRRRAYKRALETGKIQFEAKIVKTTGQVAWLELYGMVDFDKENKPVRIVGTIRDITEEKNFNELIAKSEEKYRFLSNFMPQFIWSSMPNGTLNFWNQAVFDYTGYNLEELMGEPGWINVVHPDDRERTVNSWIESIETGVQYNIEHRFKNTYGEYKWYLSRAVPRYDEDGEIASWIGTSTDIDEIKKLEQQKNDFIKMANHELKTPVTTIKGYVQLLNKTHATTNDPVLKQSLETINKQVNKLNNLIGDLLDITRMETGNLPLKKEVFKIADLIDDAIKDVVAATTHENVHFDKNGLANEEIYADRDRINQVILNLLTNAIKYSPPQSNIYVSIDKNEELITASVKDEGIGIDKEHLKKIFKRFYRVPGEQEKTFPGFGIGLYIVAEIMERHQGKAWATSEKGVGSTFYISLPIFKGVTES